MTYTTTARIEGYLEETLPTALTSGTPSIMDDILGKIDEDIEDQGETKFVETTETDKEIHIESTATQDIKLPFKPLISITKLETNDGTEFVPDWTVIDAAEYYIIELATSRVRLEDEVYAGNRVLRSTFKYGYATTPQWVVDLATNMGIRELIKMAQGNTAYTSQEDLTVSVIKITKNLSLNFVRQLTEDIKKGYDRLNSLRTY